MLNKDDDRFVFFGVAILAMATLLFEVLLTRIFAVTLWYHFGFLAISLALAGTSAGALLNYIFQNKLMGIQYKRNLTLCAVFFSIGATGSVWLHLGTFFSGNSAGSTFLINFFVLVMALFLTFFFSGLCISMALSRYSNQMGRIYFFDLCGAAIGSFLVVPLLTYLSGLALVFWVSALGFLAAALFTAHLKKYSMGLIIAAVLTLTLGLINDGAKILKITTVKSYKDLEFQQIEGDTIFEKWSPVSRVTVLKSKKNLQGLNTMLIQADAGAPATMVEYKDESTRLMAIKSDCQQVGQWLRPNSDILIIGSAGGLDISAAIALDQKKITAVEINPITAQLVTENYANFIGNIFQNPKVSLHVQEGRNFVAGSPDKYDLIQLSMIDSWAGSAAGAYIFNENSLYTVEAVEDYLKHLKPNGIIAITRYVVWGELLRLTNIFIEALERKGFKDAKLRIAVTSKDSSEIPRGTVLLKNGLFNNQELEKIEQVSANCRGNLIYLPGKKNDNDLNESWNAVNIRKILTIDSTERAAYIENNKNNYSVSTDDKPFFFFTTRLQNVFNLEMNKQDHAARRYALPALYGALMVFSIVAVMSLLIFSIFSGLEVPRGFIYSLRSLTFFAMIGAGFIFIEISLMQRLTIFLGHPTWSFILVLTVILFASGLGSFWSDRFSDKAKSALKCTTLAIVFLTGAYALILFDQFNSWMSASKAMRVLISAATLFPLGFLLGTCFPLGSQIIKRVHPRLIPLGWAINGIFSVFASVCSLVIAINFGFKAALITGTICYLIAAILITTLQIEIKK